MRALVKAALAELVAVPSLTVYDGFVPVKADGTLPALPYVTVYADTGVMSGDSLDLASNRADVTVWVNATGATAESARIVAEKARAALLDKRLIVTGWATWPVRHLATQPVRRDDDVTGQVVFLAVDQYRLSADRA